MDPASTMSTYWTKGLPGCAFVQCVDVILLGHGLEACNPMWPKRKGEQVVRQHSHDQLIHACISSSTNLLRIGARGPEG